MIICAAIKFTIRNNDNTMKDVVIPCIRHGHAFNIVKQLNFKYESSIQGFLDNENNFYDRKEALKIALQNKQLPQTVLYYKQDNNDIELYSEDLY